jgi:hypothetical protein
MPGGPSTALNTNNSSSSSSSSSSSIGDLSHVCERAHERNVLTERLVRTHARQPLGTGTLDCEREREARVHTFMSVTCHAYRNTKHKRTHGQRETHTHTSPDTFAHTDRSTRAHAHAYAHTRTPTYTHLLVPYQSWRTCHATCQAFSPLLPRTCHAFSLRLPTFALFSSSCRPHPHQHSRQNARPSSP